MILRGRGLFRCRGETHLLGPGCLFLLPPREKVFYRADDEEPWEYYFFNIVGENAGEWMESAGFSCGKLTYTDASDSALRHFARAFESAVNDPADSLSVLGELLLATARLCPGADMPRRESYAETAKRYMESNYYHPMRISDIAEYIGIDRTHLYREFIRDTGLSPQEWLLVYRLNQARRLMNRGDLTLTEIALSTGFCDLTHFSHAYREKYEAAPGKDRLLIKAREQSGGRE
jgi:AraC-like DNA-binding protein